MNLTLVSNNSYKLLDELFVTYLKQDTYV